MQAIRLFQTGDLRLVTVPDPAPAPGEVLVRIEAAGICGTDRHLYRGEFPCTPPVTLGHEFAGIVTALGAGVTGLALGTRVTCDPNIACGTCPHCLRGRVNLCERLSAIGIHRDGGFAEQVAIPAHRTFSLPATLDPQHGALCEPLACCLHAVDKGAPRVGERVTILGGGVIGLLTLQLARLAGAETLLVTRSPAKRRLAEDLGATATAPTAEAARAIWPAGADLTIECAGVAETVAMAPCLTRRGGRIVVMGVLPQGVRVALEPFDLLVREIDLLHAFLNPFTHARAADLIATGRIAVAPLITRTIPLAEAAAAIAHPAGADDIRVLIVPG